MTFGLGLWLASIVMAGFVSCTLVLSGRIGVHMLGVKESGDVFAVLAAFFAILAITSHPGVTL